jgi:O-antigen ligase
MWSCGKAEFGQISRNGMSGYHMLVMLPGLLLIPGWLVFTAITAQSILLTLVGLVTFVTMLVLGIVGFFMVHPNQARVLTLFGNYVGSARETGLRWANPFFCQKDGVAEGA